MPPRTIEAEGRRWRVTPSGRRTQYSRDEFSLTFTSLDDDRERRVVRYSPLATKSPDDALSRLDEARLGDLLRRSQPAWTSPDAGYGR